MEGRKMEGRMIDRKERKKEEVWMEGVSDSGRQQRRKGGKNRGREGRGGVKKRRKERKAEREGNTWK